MLVQRIVLLCGSWGMLAGCLVHWDMMWKDFTPAFREDVKIEVGHIDRAVALLQMLWEVRAAWKEGTVESVRAAVGRASGEGSSGVNVEIDDRNIAGCPVVPHFRTTEVIRRFMCKATPSDLRTWYDVKILDCFNICTLGEKRDKKKRTRH